MKFNLIKIIVLLSAFLIINTVKAEENIIITKINENLKINGKTYTISSTNKQHVQRYLIRHVLSTNDSNIIAEDIDEMIEVFKGASTPNWDELDEGEKNKITNLVADINDKTNVKIEINSEGVVTVYEPNGDVFATLDKAFEEVKEETIEVTKKEEDTTSNLAIIFGGVSFICLVMITNNVIRHHP